MQCLMKVEKPEKITYTLSITMTAGDWKKLDEQLAKSALCQSYPSWQLRDQINDVLTQANRHYWPSIDTAVPPGADADQQS